MGVFNNSPYGQQGISATPDFTGAARTSALVQAQNQQRKDAQKQQNLQGGFALANALRSGGNKDGGSVIGDLGGAIADGWKGGAATAPAATAAAAGGSAIPGASFGMGVNTGIAGAAGAGASGGLSGAASGAGAAMASNPVGWAAMAALAAYSLFG